MKNKKITDERVIEIDNRIQSEAFRIVLFLLAASVFIKSYVMDLPVSHFVAELCIMIVSMIYASVRSMFLGHNFMNYSKNRKAFTVILILGLSIVVSIFNGIKNYLLYSDKYTGIFDVHFIAVVLFTFAASTIFISAVFFLLSWLNKKGQQRIERKLDEDAQDELCEEKGK